MQVLFGTEGCQEVQLDDPITREHTKCKPVAVSVVIESGTRRILGLDAAPIPASGPLAKMSRSRYGKRADGSRAMRNALLAQLKPWIAPDACFSSDDHRHCPVVIRHHLRSSLLALLTKWHDPDNFCRMRINLQR